MKNPVDFTEAMARQIVDEVGREEADLSVSLSGYGEPLQSPELLGIVDAFGAYDNIKNLHIVTSGVSNADKFRRNQLEALLSRTYKRHLYFEHSFNLFHSSFPERLMNMIDMKMRVKNQNHIGIRAAMSVDNCQRTWGGIEKIIKSVAEKSGTEMSYFPLGSYTERKELFFLRNIPDLMRLEYEGLKFLELESWLTPRVYLLRNESFMFGFKVNPVPLGRKGRARNLRAIFHHYSNTTCAIFHRSGNPENVSLCVWPDGSIYPESGCKVEHLKLGRIGIDSLADMIERKRVFAERIAGSLIMDKRQLRRGTSDNVCTLCQYLVAERGFELK